MHSLADTKNVQLRVENSRDSIVMDYDPERLLQIVHNLLSNAIKFTPAGGEVVMKLETGNSKFENGNGKMENGDMEQFPISSSPFLISISDTGVGITPEELPLVFDRFFQAKNQEKTKTGGTGIGLSLTRELVRAMNGDISVESRVGAGTTFKVELPVANKAELATESVPAARFMASDGLAHHLKVETLTHNLEAGSHLLIIEDNPDVVEYLAACLGKCYHLDFAYDGQAGIEKAIATIPDLIISDVMMPEKDGFEVVETLKNDERTSHIPIILLTARSTVADRIAGLKRGADAYLAKPFVEEELLVVATGLMETRRKLQEKYRHTDLETAPAVAAQNPEATEQKSFFDLENLFLQKVIALIDAHLDDAEFGNAELSRKMLMSESQLHRKIKALTDLSLSVFIRSVRLRRGRVLLQTTHLTVSEIAYSVGFTDLAYFSRTFSAEFGTAPSTFRKEGLQE
ncbi:MAG: response regulator [Lewinellaceae bacterium]|nr:response regulator [Lewinellaceae bacterium]